MRFHNRDGAVLALVHGAACDDTDAAASTKRVETLTGTPILNPNQPLAIGTNRGSSTFTGILNIAGLEGCDSYLSDDDLTHRAETIRSLGLLKGISA